MRFVKENAIVDEFLFCQEMKERTRAKDVFDLVNAFLRENSIARNRVGLAFTDGAPAMLGHRSDFVARTKQVAPHIVSNHCANIICIQESNLNSSSSFRIPGFSALRSDRTHSRSGILSPDATRASGGVVIFVRQGLSFL